MVNILILFDNNGLSKINKKDNISLSLESEYIGYINMDEEEIALERGYLNIMKDFYALGYIYSKESCDELLLEGLSDIGRMIKGWLNNLKEFIISIFSKLFKFVEGLFTTTDKFIEKHKDEIRSIKAFKADLFKYDLSAIERAPITGEINDIISSYNRISNLKNISKSEIDKSYKDFMDDDNLDSLRGKILGTNKSINMDDYLNEIKKTFRGGSNTPSNIDIDSNKLQSIMGDYGRIKDLINKAKKDRDILIKNLETLKSLFERGASKYRDGNGNYYSARSVSTDEDAKVSAGKEERLEENDAGKIELYYKYHFNMTKQILTMTRMVITEKVNCLNEMSKSHKDILMKAIKQSNSKDED